MLSIITFSNTVSNRHKAMQSEELKYPPARYQWQWSEEVKPTGPVCLAPCGKTSILGSRPPQPEAPQSGWPSKEKAVIDSTRSERVEEATPQRQGYHLHDRTIHNV